MIDLVVLDTLYLEAVSDSDLTRKSLSAKADEFLSELTTDSLLELEEVPVAADIVMGALSSKQAIGDFLHDLSQEKATNYKLLYVLLYSVQLLRFSPAVQQYAVSESDILILVMMMVSSNDKFSSISC